jgi:uncharacterized protein
MPERDSAAQTDGPATNRTPQSGFWAGSASEDCDHLPARRALIACLPKGRGVYRRGVCFPRGGRTVKQRISALLTSGVLALALFGAAMAAPFEDGVAAYKRGEYAAGPFEDGVVAYNRGDYATALQIFRRLADQGNATAQYDLGVMYGQGQGVPQDYAQAVAWYRQAAEQGVVAAQHNLGVAYLRGRGVTRDNVLAYMWLNLAALRAKDATVRETAAEDRDLVAAFMTPAQIAEALRLADEWRPK